MILSLSKEQSPSNRSGWMATSESRYRDEQMAHVADDLYPRPYEQNLGAESDVQDYLNWELKLVEKLDRDGLAHFLAKKPK